MLQQIVFNTPFWVWLLLAFLLYRGFLASSGREVPLRKTLIIPLLMLMLSAQGMLSSFGLTALTAPVWLSCFLLAAGIVWWRFQAGNMLAQPQRGVIFVPGSWLPMALMISIFMTKYVVGVLLALHPEQAQQAPFAATVCALYGFFSGIFIGKMGRMLQLYRAAEAGQQAGGAAPSRA